MSSRPHYLRFARALSLVAGVASAAGCTATPAASDAGCASCDYRETDCDGGGPGPFPDTGVEPRPLCSAACFAIHDTGRLGICGPLPPPNLA